MKTKSLLFILFTATLFAIGTIITLLFNTAPTETATIATLYISIFVAILGVIFFGFYGYNYYNHASTPPWKSTAASLRWGFLTGCFVVVSLMLSSYSALNTPTFLVLIVATIIVEFVWRKRKSVA
jgi:hypothetical protein